MQTPLEAADNLAAVVRAHYGTAHVRDRDAIMAALTAYQVARTAPLPELAHPAIVTDDGRRAARALMLWELGSASYASDVLAIATADDPMAALQHAVGAEQMASDLLTEADQ